MHYILLNPWVGFSTDNSGVFPFVGWLVGLLVVGWLGIKWWGAHIARQFEREPLASPPPAALPTASPLSATLSTASPPPAALPTATPSPAALPPPTPPTATPPPAIDWNLSGLAKLLLLLFVAACYGLALML